MNPAPPVTSTRTPPPYCDLSARSCVGGQLGADKSEGLAQLAHGLGVVRVDRDAGEAQDQLARERLVVVLGGVAPARCQVEVDAAVDLDEHDATVGDEPRIQIADLAPGPGPVLELGHGKP